VKSLLDENQVEDEVIEKPLSLTGPLRVTIASEQDGDEEFVQVHALSLTFKDAILRLPRSLFKEGKLPETFFIESAKNIKIVSGDLKTADEVTA
jgi:hypothetical protein